MCFFVFKIYLSQSIVGATKIDGTKINRGEWNSRRLTV